MTKRITPGVAPRLYFVVLDSTGEPVTDLVVADITSIAYRLITNGVAGATSSTLSLTAAVVTDSHSTGSTGPVRASDGWYFCDAPVGAADASADAVELVVVLDDGTHVVYPSVHEIDVKVSTRSSHSAADVWSVVERTLTEAAGGASAQQVWEYTQRTLSQSQPPSQNTGAAGRFNLTAGYDWVLPFTLGNLGSWEALLFTVKLSPDDTDDEAKIAIRLSNPGDGDDGLQRLNGEVATKGQAAINVVNATTGEIAVTVFAVATVEIAPNEGRFYYYDIKRLVGSGSAPATGQQGVITVARAITRATS